MGLLSLFKQKKRELNSVRHYMAYLECNPECEFQFDIYSDDKVDIQIFSEKADEELSSKNKITFLLAFTEHLKTREKSLQSFFNQDFFKLSQKMKSGLEDRYYFHIDRSENYTVKLYEVISKILKEIYFYDEHTSCGLNFMELLDNGEYVQVRYVDKKGKRLE